MRERINLSLITLDLTKLLMKTSDASLPRAEPEAAVASCWWDHPELTADERAGLDAALERVPEARLLEERTTRRLARGKLTHTSQPDAARARARSSTRSRSRRPAATRQMRRRARDAAHFAASGAHLLAPWGGADAGGHALAYFEAALAAGPVDVDAIVAQYELMLERTRARTEARAPRTSRARAPTQLRP